jgi:hypothetical protein
MALRDWRRHRGAHRQALAATFGGLGFGNAADRHVRAAELLAPEMARPDDPAEHLPAGVEQLMRDSAYRTASGASDITRKTSPPWWRGR